MQRQAAKIHQCSKRLRRSQCTKEANDIATEEEGVRGNKNFRVRGEDPWTDAESGERSDDKIDESKKAGIENFRRADVYRKVSKGDYLKDCKDGKKPTIVKTKWVSGKNHRQRLRAISLIGDDEQERRSEADSMPEESERTLTEDDIAIADYMISRGIDSP